jgi:hypothetical protein
VAKLDTNLKLLFSTFLGGTSPGSPDAAVTTPTGIAIDNSGNAYLTGYTGHTSSPTTRPVLGTGNPGMPADGTFPLVYAFLTKFSADGSKVLFSVFVGGDQSSCPSGVCREAAKANGFQFDASSNVVQVYTQ